MRWIIAGLMALIFAGVCDAQVTNITLRWTATGDDSLTGTATSYQLRWNSYAPTSSTMEAWWATAARASNLPAPVASGTSQSTRVTPAGGFPAGKTYYFVIRVLDDAGNLSGYSNVAQVVVKDATRPASVADIEEGP